MRVPDHWIRALPALIGALPVVVLSLAWTLDDGGYDATAWYPGTLLVGGVLAIALISLGRQRRRLTRAVRIAIGAFAAYTAFSYLSIAWADHQSEALDGSNRTLLYLLAFTLFAILPWEPRSAFTVVTTYALAVAVIGAVALSRAISAEDPSPYFTDARFAEPLGYMNANAALWASAMFMSLLLAARRQTPLLLRALLLGGAGLTAQLGLMGQSRGWLYTLPIAWVLTLLLSGQRLRFAAFTLPVVAAVAVAADPLLDVFDQAGYREGDTRSPEEATAVMATELDELPGPVTAATGLLVLAGIGLALLDERIRPSRRTQRLATRAGWALTVVIGLGAIGAIAVATDGKPVERIERAWDDFSTYDVRANEGSRLGSLSSTRQDFWRVAIDAWADQPIGGLGQDNFLRVYLKKGNYEEEPRFVHSLPLRLLTHTGIVGALLFVAFTLAALHALLATRRQLPVRGGRVIVAAATAPFVVWWLQGSIDWLWEFPALSVPALGLVAMVGALRETAGDAAWVARPPRLPAPALGAASAAVVLVAAAVLIPPWLSAREVERAVNTFRSDPAGALRSVDRAADLNPLSADPLVTEGLLAVRAGDPQRSVQAFAEALERDSENWFALFQLGLLRSEAGDRQGARAAFRQALEIKVGDVLLREAYNRAVGRRPMSLREGDRRVLGKIRERTAR